MTPIADILAAAAPHPSGFSATIPPDWMQGRTGYGGLTSALALEAARGVEEDLPVLRSAQVAFIGPLAGAVRIEARTLRRGRNTAFIQADVSSDAGLGLRATFLFMSQLESKVAHDAIAPSGVAPPPDDAKFAEGPDNFFAGNFDLSNVAAEGAAEWRRWVRLRGRDGLDPATEILAVGDALPPGAFKLVGGAAPMSSLNWTIDLLTPAPATQDGWWLLHSRADRAQGGYSSQRMQMWNRAGELVAQGMQSVILFA